MEFKDFKDWIKKLKESSKYKPVLVEGKRDVQALKRYGIKNVYTIAGKRFSDIPDMFEDKFEEIILLFDLDEHGERINEKVKKLLLSQGFKVCEDFREFLKKQGIIHIEDIWSESHGKDGNA